CVSERSLLLNAAAAQLVSDADHARLWTWARASLADGDQSTYPLRVRGTTVRGRCLALTVEGRVIGVLIRLELHRDPAAHGFGCLLDSERGIAELVSAGLTNRQIGAALFMSPHTVDSHLRHIFRKLDITSRVQLARVVIEARVVATAADLSWT